MQRRDFISNSVLLAASSVLGAGLANASDEKKSAGNAPGDTGNSLLSAATDCNQKAELCLQHCIDSLSAGSVAMAACAGTVRDMMIYCEAIAKASARKSKRLKTLAKIAYEACIECEKECRKHKQMEICIACADACAACAQECKKTIG